MARAFSSTDVGIPAPRFEVRSDVAVARTSSREAVSPSWALIYPLDL
jgi:hypothetical protein